MLNKRRKNPHPHENWCLNVALSFCGRPRIHERFRQNRVVDAILFMPDPVDLWGPLAAFLAQRDVLIEHFSDSVSTADFSTCQEKIAYASYQYNRVPLKDQGEVRHPAMVILSHRCPDRLIREPGLFEPTEYPGIWVRRPLELGVIFLIATTHLSQDPGFDWLRLTTRVPETRWALQKVESLLNQRKLDRLTREEMEEHMLTLIIDGKTPRELQAENIRLEREKLAAEQEKLAAEQEKRVAEERLADIMEKYAALQQEMAELKKT